MCGTVRAAAKALGEMSLLKGMGYHVSGEIWSDASAALGIIHRTGLGKTRHIDTGLLWIQHTVAELRLRSQKVLGKNNPVDFFTTYLDQQTSEGHTDTMRYKFTIGRATEVPKLHGFWKSVGEYIMNCHNENLECPQIFIGWGQRSNMKGVIGVLSRNPNEKT